MKPRKRNTSHLKRDAQLQERRSRGDEGDTPPKGDMGGTLNFASPP